MKKVFITLILVIISISTLVTVTVLLKDKETPVEPSKPQVTAYYEFGKPTTLSSTNYLDVIEKSKVFVKLEEQQLSVCIYRNDELQCLKNNNYDEELNHLKNIFGSDNCMTYDESTGCNDNNFSCKVYQNGEVFCVNLNNSYSCDIYANNDVECFDDVEN